MVRLWLANMDFLSHFEYVVEAKHLVLQLKHIVQANDFFLVFYLVDIPLNIVDFVSYF